jgi:formylglycine-generating enzyme required for sulfatase activity
MGFCGLIGTSGGGVNAGLPARGSAAVWSWLGSARAGDVDGLGNSVPCVKSGFVTHGPHSMPSPVYLPDPHKPRRPSRRTLAVAGVAVAVLVGSIGVWLKQTQQTPVPTATPVQPSPAPAQAPVENVQPAPGDTAPPSASFRDCAKDCPEMIVIPAGEFTMGSPAAEKDRLAIEGPPHRVMIARPFAVSKFDVTFADWDACVAAAGCPQIGDAGFGRGTKPVINVTWNDAQQYVAWLSKITGQPYRLLTEAEWEYAARAGATTAYPWGDEAGEGNANCNGCGGAGNNRATSPVGSFKPNGFGLYDMAGNVGQWVQDCFHGDYNGTPTDGSAWTGGDCSHRVVRGGSWVDRPQFSRSARRLSFSTVFRISNLGFRVGRTLVP